MPDRPTLIGKYYAPVLERGQTVTCLYRKRKCVVTTMSAAPIPWPRVQPQGERGGSGLLVNAALVRAIKTESAEALKRWFGVSTGVVWKWRKAFGVGGRKRTTWGSKRAIRAAAQKGAAAVKAKEWTDAELDAKSELSKRLGLRPGPRWTPANGAWRETELALFGTDHDEAIAGKIRRSREAITAKRVALKIPAFSERPGGGRAWTADEVALLGTDADDAVAQQIGRTRGAVSQKRVALRARRAEGAR